LVSDFSDERRPSEIPDNAHSWVPLYETIHFAVLGCVAVSEKSDTLLASEPGVGSPDRQLIEV